MKKVHLFPDTNVFVQCKALEELDWSEWSTCEEVSLLVTRPVQSEIDRQKGSGNGRLSARARRASGMFRTILQSVHRYLEVRRANPTVRIYLRQDLKRDESLADQLSYDERDDQLVGIVALFSKLNPSEKVLLLTHDTGPMATAQMVGVPYCAVPDSWLLPPEADEAEKRTKALQAELTRLRKVEPEITSRATSDQADTLQDVGIKIYAPLSEGEIKGLLNEIAGQVPAETDFGSKTPAVRRSRFPYSILREEEEFIPCSEKEIEIYRNTHYPAWLTNCAEVLRDLHSHLNSDAHWAAATVWLANVGSRPAEDALITFSAKGRFLIMPPRYVSEEDKAKTVEVFALPRPPSAPQGRWMKNNNLANLYGGATGDFNHIRQNTVELPPYRESITSSFERDPNKFYYVERAKIPQDSFSLTCKQWRHQDDEEAFKMMLHVEVSPATYTGSLEIKVQASNMTDPLIVNQPVRITVTETSVLEAAKRLVNELIKATSVG